MIIVRPLTKKPSDLLFVPEDERKGARATVSGKMPNIYVATRDEAKSFDPENVALVGFRYRRQSHHCEITWWGGRDTELVAEAIKAIQCQAILEGRKRVEVFNEATNSFSVHERGGAQFEEALKLAGFKYEGTHKDWTKNLEDVNVFGWVWLYDGMPVFKEDTTIFLGDNETVQHYASKNIELYQKDRDYYERVDNLTFAEHIKNAQNYVLSLPQVEIIPNWTAKI